jgi:hypothetical protein
MRRLELLLYKNLVALLLTEKHVPNYKLRIYYTCTEIILNKFRIHKKFKPIFMQAIQGSLHLSFNFLLSLYKVLFLLKQGISV